MSDENQTQSTPQQQPQVTQEPVQQQPPAEQPLPPVTITTNVVFAIKSTDSPPNNPPQENNE